MFFKLFIKKHKKRFYIYAVKFIAWPR